MTSSYKLIAFLFVTKAGSPLQPSFFTPIAGLFQYVLTVSEGCSNKLKSKLDLEN